MLRIVKPHGIVDIVSSHEAVAIVGAVDAEGMLEEFAKERNYTFAHDHALDLSNPELVICAGDMVEDLG